jgi:hypothetical protein
LYLYGYIFACRIQFKLSVPSATQFSNACNKIDPLRRGSLSRQFFKTRRAGRTVESGPYFVLQGFFKGKKCSKRIPPSQTQEVEKHVENFRLFQALAEQFVTLSDQITRWECAAGDSKKTPPSARVPGGTMQANPGLPSPNIS